MRNLRIFPLPSERSGGRTLGVMMPSLEEIRTCEPSARGSTSIVPENLPAYFSLKNCFKAAFSVSVAFPGFIFSPRTGYARTLVTFGRLPSNFHPLFAASNWTNKGGNCLNKISLAWGIPWRRSKLNSTKTNPCVVSKNRVT